MKASSSARNLSFHPLPLSLLSLSLSFLGICLYVRDTFPSSSSLLHPWLFRGSLKREGLIRSSLFSGFRFPFFRAKCFENHYPRYSLSLSPSMAYFTTIHFEKERKICLCDELAIYLTHKPGVPTLSNK